jgi:flagellar biosynthetic protein FliQ
MPHALVVDLARDALLLAVTLAGPLLFVALGVGLLVSVFQAATSIQEQTLSFVPKLFAVGVVFLALLSWMLQQTIRYTTELFRSLPGLVS